MKEITRYLYCKPSSDMTRPKKRGRGSRDGQEKGYGGITIAPIELMPSEVTDVGHVHDGWNGIWDRNSSTSLNMGEHVII